MSRHTDDNNDGIADHAQVDRQSIAFRDASPEDWAGEELIGEFKRWEPGDPTPIKGPEDFDGWDEGREAPKTLAEAKQALAARIADPEAPDSEIHAGAYDFDEES